MESVEETGLRWRTVLWTQSRPGGGRLAIQVGQDSLNHRRIFNASNDFDLPGAALTGLDIDVEYSLQSLHPGHRRVALSGRLVQPIFPCGLTLLATPAPPHRCTDFNGTSTVNDGG
jgi:hypothetical protein